MPALLPYFIWIPLAGYFASLFVPRKKERLMSAVVFTALGLQIALIVYFIAQWLMEGAPVVHLKHLVLYESPGFAFFLAYYFDLTTAVFTVVGVILMLLVGVFSRYYMHRESGVKRFFNTLMLFFLGYQVVVLAGNFETLFVGWEILGITSFLLISFYRDRYLPVRNGFKVLSFYRLGDVALILAMWLSHHLWHKNISFQEWQEAGVVAAQFQQHGMLALAIALLIILAAIVKSAQAPFSTWLPRAMEGPTSSSAIFYGSLAVHIGAFLLIRTYPFWSEVAWLQAVLIAVGALTALLASVTARVQSTVKTQIAYASIAQIGLIFIEIALGWHILALVHFAGNAFLRTYQLLVSPSVLSYLIHDMFFYFKPRTAQGGGALEKWRHALYILSVREWNFDGLLHRSLWRPFKSIGSAMSFIKPWQILVALLAATGLTAAGSALPAWTAAAGPLVYACLGLALVLVAFSARGGALNAWVAALGGQALIMQSVWWIRAIDIRDMIFYLSGTVIAGIVGYICLFKLKSAEGESELAEYHGHAYEHAGLALVFLLACLGAAGFPITPTFIGIDVMFTYIGETQPAVAILLGLNFLFLELALLRIYARVFLGQHKKAYHPIAFKSS